MSAEREIADSVSHTGDTRPRENENAGSRIAHTHSGAEPEFIYGYGSRKHIRDTDPDVMTYGVTRGEWGLCGAPGGNDKPLSDLPTCARCQKKWDRREH